MLCVPVVAAMVHGQENMNDQARRLRGYFADDAVSEWVDSLNDGDIDYFYDLLLDNRVDQILDAFESDALFADYAYDVVGEYESELPTPFQGQNVVWGARMPSGVRYLERQGHPGDKFHHPNFPDVGGKHGAYHVTCHAARTRPGYFDCHIAYYLPFDSGKPGKKPCKVYAGCMDAVEVLQTGQQAVAGCPPGVDIQVIQNYANQLWASWKIDNQNGQFQEVGGNAPQNLNQPNQANIIPLAC